MRPIYKRKDDGRQSIRQNIQKFTVPHRGTCCDLRTFARLLRTQSHDNGGVLCFYVRGQNVKTRAVESILEIV